jgi:AraC family transcriptional regulator
MDYLDHHIDEDIRLDTLADVAHLSRFHFERFYTAKVHETPMATVRRLRLKRAEHVLLSGAARSITELAMYCGYGSVAAFSRAFSRAFGQAPTKLITAQREERLPDIWAPNAIPSQEPELAIVDLPVIPVVYHPFIGRAADLEGAREAFCFALARTGAPYQFWSIHPDGRVDPAKHPNAQIRMWCCAPSATLPSNLSGVARGYLPAGKYARFTAYGGRFADTPRLVSRVETETLWRVVSSATMFHFPKPTDYTPVPERLMYVYLLVAPQ